MNICAYVLFGIDDQLYAIDVRTVRKIIRAVELTPVQNSPELLLGLLNMRGRIIPVFDIRRQLGRPLRQPMVTDKMIIADADDYIIAFTVDDIETVAEWDTTEIAPSTGMFPGMEDVIVGTVARNSRTILVYATDRLFSRREINQVMDHLKHNNTLS